MFGQMPVYGFFIRHVQRIELHNVTISFLAPDMRPPLLVQDVIGITFSSVTAQRAPNVSRFVLKNVTDFTTNDCPGIPDIHLEHIGQNF